jgi:N-acetyl-beta-hexosaminidase
VCAEPAAEKGAYAQEAMYSEEEVRSLVRYARDRGIRVVPEVRPFVPAPRIAH